MVIFVFVFLKNRNAIELYKRNFISNVEKIMSDLIKIKSDITQDIKT